MNEKALIGYGPWLKYIWKGHISNWFWREKKRRRIIRNVAFGEYKMTYIDKYIPFVKSLKMPPVPDYSQYDEEDEKVYTLWFQGRESAPFIVKKCFQSLDRFYGNRLVILDDTTLYDYISLPDYIVEKWKAKKIRPANFSDIVRIELLSQRGGYWFDATDFLLEPVPEFICRSPFFMFVCSDVFFPHMFVQTCFMRAKIHDPLIMMWRELVFEYWKNEDVAFEYFLVHMLFKLLVTHNEDAKRLFERMPKEVMDPTHTLWYEKGNLPFDRSEYEKLKKAVFFQKCSYRKSKYGVNDIKPGSMADYVINGKV